MQAPGGTSATRMSRSGPDVTVERAVDRFREGRIAEAVAALTGLSDSPDLADLDHWHRVLRCATLLECHLARGDLRQAGDLSPALAEAALSADPMAAAVAEQARGELAAALGDPDTAGAHFAAAGALVSDEPEDPELLTWRLGLALVLTRQGRAAEATLLARTQLDVASASGSPYAQASALRTVATVDAAGDRLNLLRLAKASLIGLRADRLAAQIDTDLAGLLMLTGEPTDQVEALTLLRAAERYAAREELWPAQARVRRLLERLGAPPQRGDGDTATLLTTAERRVAQLAADGLTNRQIAEELVVTVKAVEWHLSHIYRKLGISSRRALGSALNARV